MEPKEKLLKVFPVSTQQAESPGIFSDYELVPLPDGTHATHTVHPKV